MIGAKDQKSQNKICTQLFFSQCAQKEFVPGREVCAIQTLSYIKHEKSVKCEDEVHNNVKF